MYSIETYDIITGKQFKLNDYASPKYSNHYSPKGSGFGYLTFEVHRKPDRNYEDIGYFFEVILRKGLKKILFYGIITKIEETEEGIIKVSCLGHNVLLSYDIKNFVVADQRINQWVGGCTPVGSYRPDKFDLTNDWDIIFNEGEIDEYTISYEGLEFSPKRGVDYAVDDYLYSRYRFQFGETAERIKFEWSCALPNNWPGKFSLYDGDENLLWSIDYDGNGSQDIDITSSTNFITAIFEVTADGENTAEEETVYFRMWDITVYSTDDDPPDAGTVGRSVAAHMSSYFGFNSDTSLIEDTGFEVEQAAYDTDQRLDQVMNDACKYGDGSINEVVWGTSFDDTKRIFVQIKDTSTVRYVIDKYSGKSVSGDLAQTYQKVYGRYKDKFGLEQRTDVTSADDQITALGGLYRKEVLNLGEVTEDQATQALSLALSENKEPKVAVSFDIQEYALDLAKNKIPFDELISGAIVQVNDFIVKEAAILDDKRSGFHSFFLTKVEVDLDNRTATLSPETDVTGFSKYMEMIERMSNDDN